MLTAFHFSFQTSKERPVSSLVISTVSNNVGGENLWMQRRNASFHSHDDLYLILENITTEDEAEKRSGKFKHFLLNNQTRNAKDIVSNL